MYLVLRSVGFVLGTAMLGIGAIFQPKVKADDHWSTSPKIVLVNELRREGSSTPSGSFELPNPENPTR